jgi:uncharacterized protein YegP (UPF0339 family)
MRNLIIEVKQNKLEEWYWCLVAPNGEVLSVSEGYSSKQACMDTVEMVKNYIPNSETRILED